MASVKRESTCFVIMRYGETAEEKVKANIVYDEFIKRATIDAGFVAEKIDRADIGSANKGSQNKFIFTKLASADLVIADLSGGSRSVYYELGVRHALRSKKTLVIIRDGEEVAFALKNDQPFYTYEDITTTNILVTERERLAKKIAQKVDDTNDETDNPVFTFNENLQDFTLRIPPSDATKELQSKNEQLQAENQQFICLINKTFK